MGWLSCQETEGMERWHRAETAVQDGHSLAATALRDGASTFASVKSLDILNERPLLKMAFLVQGRRSKMKLRLVTEVTELWVRRVEYDCMAAFGLRLFIHSGASAFLPRLIPARLNPCLKSRVWTVRRLAAARSFNPLPARLSGVYSRSSCAVTEYQLATRQSVSVKSALQCQAPFGSAGV